MAAKQGEGTKRCYMRAQKGALGFEIADLKKIEVTLTVGKDGVVNAVDSVVARRRLVRSVPHRAHQGLEVPRVERRHATASRSRSRAS